MNNVEYPTEELLKQITEFEVTDFHAFMDFIRPHWEFNEWGWKRDGEIYHISTGGWSGNESIVEAMEHNQMFWIMYWQQSTRGGHYIFAPLTMETINKLSGETS